MPELSRLFRRLAPLVLIGLPGMTAAQTTRYDFDVLIDGRHVGQHAFEVRSDADTTAVRSAAEFDVRILAITLYRYRHEASEIWSNGCLVALRSTTNDNGEASAVSAQAHEHGLEIRSTEHQSAVAASASVCTRSFAYWNIDLLTDGPLLNAQTGALVPAQLVHEGDELLDDTETLRYRLDLAGLPSITLWYRQEDRLWIGLETERDGRVIRYQPLRAPSDRQVSLPTEEPATLTTPASAG